MNLDLTLFVKLSVTFVDDLVEFLSKQTTLLSLPDGIPAKGVESSPQCLWSQPNRPCDLVSLDRCGEEWLLSLGLAFENLFPQQVAETRLRVCLFVEVQLTKLLLPVCRRRPSFGAVVLRCWSVFSCDSQALGFLEDAITVFDVPNHSELGTGLQNPMDLFKGLFLGEPLTLVRTFFGP